MQYLPEIGNEEVVVGNSIYNNTIKWMLDNRNMFILLSISNKQTAKS